MLWVGRLAVGVWVLLAAGCGGGGGDTLTNPPVCGVSPSTLNFGSVVVGQTVDQTLTITNSGQGTLAGAVSEACTDYSIQGSATYSLGPGASATITVRFAPSAPGARNCTVNTGTGCATVSCAGTGVASPCQITPAALDFGTVTLGSSADRSFTIMNAGSVPLVGTVSSPCADYTIQGTASYTLDPGNSAVITVRFAPSVAGSSSCTIETGDAMCADVASTGTTGPELNSPSLGPGAVYPHTFMTAGSYPYHCEFHLMMRATVTVNAAGPLSASVSIVNSTAAGFNPLNVTVAPGGTVTWTNNHSVIHTVTSD
jgi:plastocyanin